VDISEPVKKLIGGVFCLGFGVVLFAYVSMAKRKNNVDFKIYDFKFYGVSIALMLAGLYLFYLGISDF